MVAFILWFDLNYRSLWGQMSSKKVKFWNSFFKLKHMYLMQYCLRIPVVLFALVYDVQNRQKLWLQILTSWHCTLNGAIWWAKMDGMTWNLPCRITTCRSPTIPFFWKFQKSSVLEICSKKMIFGILGVTKPKISKNRESHLVQNLISFNLTFFVCNLFQYWAIYDGSNFRPFMI